jgi:hypothetical protein
VQENKNAQRKSRKEKRDLCVRRCTPANMPMDWIAFSIRAITAVATLKEFDRFKSSGIYAHLP